MKKILITGGDGRFANELKKFRTVFKMIFLSKELNISSSKSIKKNLEKFKPDYVFHLAGLSRPMKLHKIDICKSIELNIIGTCNIVKECSKKYKTNLFFF